MDAEASLPFAWQTGRIGPKDELKLQWDFPNQQQPASKFHQIGYWVFPHKVTWKKYMLGKPLKVRLFVLQEQKQECLTPCGLPLARM